MVSLMSLRVSGRSFSGWLSALDTVPSETPASRATSLILTFAIAAPLMRFKYESDCSIARSQGVKTHQLGAGLFWQVLSGQTPESRPHHCKGGAARCLLCGGRVAWPFNCLDL